MCETNEGVGSYCRDFVGLVVRLVGTVGRSRGWSSHDWRGDVGEVVYGRRGMYERVRDNRGFHFLLIEECRLTVGHRVRLQLWWLCK